MMKTHALLIPLILTLALVACGDKQENTASVPAPPTPVAKTLPTACQLVTAADVQAAFRQAVTTMEDSKETCIYNATGDPGAFILLTTQLTPNGNVTEAADTFQMMLKMQGGMNEMFNATLNVNNTAPNQQLAGIGDEVWFKAGTSNPLEMTQAMVRKGTVILSITATGMDKKHSPQFEDLVRKTVDKL